MATEQNPRKEAAEALIQWATTCMGSYAMRNKVEAYLEASGANLPSIGGDAAIIAHWRKRSIPTHSNGSIHSLLSPKIGLRSA